MHIWLYSANFTKLAIIKKASLKIAKRVDQKP